MRSAVRGLGDGLDARRGVSRGQPVLYCSVRMATRQELIAKLRALASVADTHLTNPHARYFDPPHILDLFTRPAGLIVDDPDETRRIDRARRDCRGGELSDVPGR
jgi:hypothetical protein